MGKLGNFPPYSGERGTGDLDAIPSTSELLHGVEKQSKRLLVMNNEDRLMAQQLKNESLLISSFDPSRKADKARK
jgi:hypothetical protein